MIQNNIIKASIEHVSAIQKVAYNTWPDTFKAILTPDQIKYMLAWMYSNEALFPQIEGPKAAIYLYLIGTQTVAFCSIEHCYKDTKDTRIHKLYCLPTYQGRGIGKALLNHVTRLAQAQNATGLHLNVNRQNKAVAFYLAYGFEIIAEEDIAIGNGFQMNDYQMRKKLI